MGEGERGVGGKGKEGVVGGRGRRVEGGSRGRTVEEGELSRRWRNWLFLKQVGNFFRFFFFFGGGGVYYVLHERITFTSGRSYLAYLHSSVEDNAPCKLLKGKEHSRLCLVSEMFTRNVRIMILIMVS